MTTYCLYWTQYSCNFLVYAARSDQYRKAYYDFLVVMWNRFARCKINPMDDSAILFVDKSLLPPKLLEFYTRNLDVIALDQKSSRQKKSVRFDMTRTIQNEHNQSSSVDSILNTNKCGEKCQKICQMAKNNNVGSSRIELKIHIPRKNKRQCPIIFVTSVEMSAKKRHMRRNSDSKLERFINVGRQTIDIDLMNSMSKTPDLTQHTISKNEIEEFSIGINMKSRVSLNKAEKKSMPYKESVSTVPDILSFINHNSDISLDLGKTSNTFKPSLPKSFRRQNSI